MKFQKAGLGFKLTEELMRDQMNKTAEEAFRKMWQDLQQALRAKEDEQLLKWYNTMVQRDQEEKAIVSVCQ